MPQGYIYGLRVGFPPGTIGSEILPVVDPPAKEPGRSRVKLWYNTQRKSWIGKTVFNDSIKDLCTTGNQYWLTCAFRWMHFLQQQKKLSEIQSSTNAEFKSALQQAIPSADLFRLEYVLNFCHLRRVWQKMSDGESFIISDSFGMCPSVCGERSGIPKEDEEKGVGRSSIEKLENRLVQCEAPNSLPTVLTTKCVPDPKGK
ncbi:hypothetical protein Aperf_G00000029273 [Anoplocephala perfoliata]